MLLNLMKSYFHGGLYNSFLVEKVHCMRQKSSKNNKTFSLMSKCFLELETEHVNEKSGNFGLLMAQLSDTFVWCETCISYDNGMRYLPFLLCPKVWKGEKSFLRFLCCKWCQMAQPQSLSAKKVILALTKLLELA